MKWERLKKLEGIIKGVVSNNILEYLDNLEDKFGLITITKVKVSPDLSYTDVYISCLSNNKDVVKELALFANKIKKNIMRKVSIRKIPRIRFRYDERWKISWEVIDVINNLDIK